ncbi:hypothetical protein CE195_06215, partial [Sodalis-like symbiont of Philaenus spumarius]
MSATLKTKNSPPLLAVLLLLVAMISIHSGAALAKSLFPVIGAEGLIALRQAIGTMILLVVFRPWRLRTQRIERNNLTLRTRIKRLARLLALR